MPKELKELLADDLKKRFAEQGAPDLLDKIADETVGVDAQVIRDYLESVGHPALTMEDMAVYVQSGAGSESYDSTPQRMLAHPAPVDIAQAIRSPLPRAEKR